MKMNAKELYSLSVTNGRYKVVQNHPTLTNRTVNALARSNMNLMKNGYLDKEKILELILNGKIWGVRGCGEKTVRQLCEWLGTDGGLNGQTTGELER